MEKILSDIYSKRFSVTYKKRELVWKSLIKYFFQDFIPENGNVLEIAAGYCHFINNINAQKKVAVDLNEDIKRYANKNVIEKINIQKTLEECNRLLKKDGILIVLQPNIRFLYKEYWMFFDHITPLDDQSLTEIISLNKFNIIKCLPKFLPFTMQGKIPVSKYLIYLYLKIPILWTFFGKQALVIASK